MAADSFGLLRLLVLSSLRYSPPWFRLPLLSLRPLPQRSRRYPVGTSHVPRSLSLASSLPLQMSILHAQATTPSDPSLPLVTMS